MKQVIEIKADLQSGPKDTGQRTVFYDVLTNDDIGLEEKGTEHLKGEAQSLVAAVRTPITHCITHWNPVSSAIGYHHYCTRTLHHFIPRNRQPKDPRTVAARTGKPDEQRRSTADLAATRAAAVPCKRYLASEFIEKLTVPRKARSGLRRPKVRPQCTAKAILRPIHS